METLDLALVKRQVQAPEYVYVSTLNGEGYPVTRVMFNLHSIKRCPKSTAFLAKLGNEFNIYLGTNAASAKVSDLSRTPRLSTYFHVPNSWQGLLVAGEAEVVLDREIKRGLWQEEWSMYYEGGVEGADYTIIRLHPVFAEYYHDLIKETLKFEKN
jgi:general stress protein 26